MPNSRTPYEIFPSYKCYWKNKINEYGYSVTFTEEIFSHQDHFGEEGRSQHPFADGVIVGEGSRDLGFKG